MKSLIVCLLFGGVFLAVPAAFAAEVPSAAVPVLAATHSCAAAACPDKAAPAKYPNGMVVTPGTFNMGKMMDVEARKINFVLTNSNTQAVKVLRVRAGCSCTKVTDFSQTLIPPGGKLTVTLEVLGDKLPKGDWTRTAMVEVEGLTPPTVPLKYTGSKTQPITIKPRASVNLGKLVDPAATWTRTFEIIGNLDDGKILTLGVPVCSAPLKAELKALKPSHYQLTVTQTGTRAWGMFKDRVQVPVTAPVGYSTITFSLSGQAGERLLVSPLMVWFPETAAGKTATAMRRTFKIKQGVKAVRVVKAEDVKPKLPPGVKVVGVTQNGLRAAVEVEFAPAFFAKERRETLFFSTPVGQTAALVAVGGESPISTRYPVNEDVVPVEGARAAAPEDSSDAASAVPPHP